MSEPMNGGDGSYSYSKNSKFQGVGFDIAKALIENSITENLDVKSILSTTSAASNTFNLADLGCSTGPNTFAAMQSLITSISQKYKSQNSNNSSLDHTNPLEFQVFFNDLPTNDFNTLIATLPSPRSYFAAVVPGSFFGRLFPTSSLHLVYANYAIHWLSKIPDECLDRNDKAWNKGRIHFPGGCEAVVEAHEAQFGRDLDEFLKARDEEMVSGGMLVLITIGCPDDMPRSCLPNSMLYELLGSALLDMAKRGLIEEEQVDSFNLPLYAVRPKEIKAAVDRNGSFKIEIMDLHGFAPIVGTLTMADWKTNNFHIRASFEPLIVNHFGQEIVDELFELLFQKTMENVKALQESSDMNNNQLLVVLKRL